MLTGPPRFCSTSCVFLQARTGDYNAIMRKKTTSLLCRNRPIANSTLKAVAGRYESPLYISSSTETSDCNIFTNYVVLKFNVLTDVWAQLLK